MRRQISLVEKLILAFIFLLFFIGIVGSYIDTEWFDMHYAREDGFIEWMTVIALVLAGLSAQFHLINKKSNRSFLFFCCMFGITALCIFAAGEEVSWGQRILNVKSPEYFIKNNAQGETNVHNLVVGKTKLNKLVFTLFLGIVAGVYLFIIPILHSFSSPVRRFLDTAGVPIAKWYHILSIATFAGVHLLAKSNNGREPEIFEFGVCALFFLIVAFPNNLYAFKSAGKNNL